MAAMHLYLLSFFFFLLATGCQSSPIEKRTDDSTLEELQTLLQQQAAINQQQAATIHQQGAMLLTLQAKLTADESTAHQQAATIQQQGAMLQILQTKMATEKNTINTLQAVQARQDKAVAFTAGFNGIQSVDIGQHGIIVFDKAITNIGGGFHTSTGLFTAPVAGVYAFTLNIRGDNVHDFIAVEITKDGSTHLCSALVEHPARDQYDKNSCSAVVHLNVGEQVFARRSAGYSTFLEEGELTALTGFLVHAD